jgi:hypothetical protein
MKKNIIFKFDNILLENGEFLNVNYKDLVEIKRSSDDKIPIIKLVIKN